MQRNTWRQWKSKSRVWRQQESEDGNVTERREWNKGSKRLSLRRWRYGQVIVLTFETKYLYVISLILPAILLVKYFWYLVTEFHAPFSVRSSCFRLISWPVYIHRSLRTFKHVSAVRKTATGPYLSINRCRHTVLVLSLPSKALCRCRQIADVRSSVVPNFQDE